MKITIQEETENSQETADLLRHIAEMIEDGFTSGYYPHWQLDGEETEEPEDGEHE